MELFNIGIPELIVILVLALVILGPRDMVTTARKLGHWVNRVVRSPFWKELMGISQEMRDLPTRIVRDARLEDIEQMNEETMRAFQNELRPSNVSGKETEQAAREEKPKE